MASYSTDITDKLQVKYLKDCLKMPIPLIAAIQNVSRRTVYYRYDTVTFEIEHYQDAKEEWEKYLDERKNVKLPDFVQKMMLLISD